MNLDFVRRIMKLNLVRRPIKVDLVRRPGLVTCNKERDLANSFFFKRLDLFFIQEMTETLCVRQEKKEEDDLPTLKIVSIHQYNS